MLLSLATGSNAIKVSIQNGYMEYATITVAVLAFFISVIVAWLQIDSQRREWRPILAYDSTVTTFKSEDVDPILYIDYEINYDNVGKVPLVYRMTYLEIFIDGNKMEVDYDESSKGAVIAPGHKGSFTIGTRFIKEEHSEWLEKLTPPKVRIKFKTEYASVTNKKSKYHLEYDLETTFEPAGRGKKEVILNSEAD